MAIRGLIRGSVTLLALFGCGTAMAQLDTARSAGIAYLVRAQQGDGSWRGGGALTVQTTVLAAEGLRRGGMMRSPAYTSALAFLSNANPDSVDSAARRIAALAAAGADVQADVDRLFQQRELSDRATWGAYNGHGASFVDTPLGLAALRTADRNYDAKSTALIGALCAIMTGRVADASGTAWPLAPPATNQPALQQRPNLLATALTLYEVRQLQRRPGVTGVTCNSTNYTLDTVVDQAKTWLLAQRNADNGYGERRPDSSLAASNVLLSALVYRTLSALRAPPEPQTSNALSYRWPSAMPATAVGVAILWSARKCWRSCRRPRALSCRTPIATG